MAIEDVFLYDAASKSGNTYKDGATIDVTFADRSDGSMDNEGEEL